MADFSPPEGASAPATKMPFQIRSTPALCDACYEEYPGSQMLAMECEHYFCRTCYKGYLSSVLDTRGINAVETQCP